MSLIRRALSDRAIMPDLPGLTRFLNEELRPVVREMRSRLNDFLTAVVLPQYAEGSEPALDSRPPGERAALVLNETSGALRYTVDGVDWQDVGSAGGDGWTWAPFDVGAAGPRRYDNLDTLFTALEAADVGAGLVPILIDDGGYGGYLAIYSRASGPYDFQNRIYFVAKQNGVRVRPTFDTDAQFTRMGFVGAGVQICSRNPAGAWVGTGYDAVIFESDEWSPAGAFTDPGDEPPFIVHSTDQLYLVGPTWRGSSRSLHVENGGYCEVDGTSGFSDAQDFASGEVGATLDIYNSSLQLALTDDTDAFPALPAFLGTYGRGIYASTLLSLTRGITAAGATGNKTINRASGSVRMAAGQTSLVVTTSAIVDSDKSMAFAEIATNDLTARKKCVTVGAGFFTIVMEVAPTAEIRINWVVNS